MDSLYKLAVHGISLGWLIDHYRMKPRNAYLTLRWLEQEPRAALKSLREGIQ